MLHMVQLRDDMMALSSFCPRKESFLIYWTVNFIPSFPRFLGTVCVTYHRAHEILLFDTPVVTPGIIDTSVALFMRAWPACDYVFMIAHYSDAADRYRLREVVIQQ
ncbi:unnamed protein product [Scytosiphon promiscuus]